jgi:hypothetical protein
MTVSVKVDTSRYDTFARRFARQKVGDALIKAGLFLQRELTFAPPKKAGAFTRLATPKQKRKYLAMVRSGEVRHGAGGYIRTGNTQRSWTAKKRSVMSVEVGNASPGAYFVYSAEAQQPFHAASKWPRVDTFAKKHEREIGRIIDREVNKILGG